MMFFLLLSLALSGIDGLFFFVIFFFDGVLILKNLFDWWLSFLLFVLVCEVLYMMVFGNLVWMFFSSSESSSSFSFVTSIILILCWCVDL